LTHSLNEPRAVREQFRVEDQPAQVGMPLRVRAHQCRQFVTEEIEFEAMACGGMARKPIQGLRKGRRVRHQFTVENSDTTTATGGYRQSGVGAARGRKDKLSELDHPARLLLFQRLISQHLNSTP
jgi:hypothetical protein